jgi:hypothetical protein
VTGTSASIPGGGIGELAHERHANTGGTDLGALLLRREQELRVVHIVCRDTRDRSPEQRAVVRVHRLAGRLLVARARAVRDPGRPRVAREPVAAACHREVWIRAAWVHDVAGKPVDVSLVLREPVRVELGDDRCDRQEIPCAESAGVRRTQRMARTIVEVVVVVVAYRR